MEQAPQECPIRANRRNLGDHAAVEFGCSSRGEVVQPRVFQPTPQNLDGVEHWRERSQSLQTQSIGELSLHRANRFPLMHGAAVPNDHEPAREVAQHGLKEGRHIPVVEVAVGQRVEVEAQLASLRGQPQRRGDGDLLPVGSVLLSRCDAAAGPSSDHSRRSG